MATIHRQTLVQLLAADYSVKQIANHLGVNTEAVAHAMDTDSSLSLDVAQVKNYQKTDNNYDAIELAASERLRRTVHGELDPMKLLKIATGINALKRRSQFENSQMQNAAERAAVIPLALPKRVPVKYDINEHKEVTGVNGKSLVSMPAQQLLRQEKPKVEERINARPHLPQELTSEDIKELL